MVDYNVSNRFVTQSELSQIRSNAINSEGPIRLTDPAVDDQWANYHSATKAPKSYFDYYFSGSDMKVYVAELADSTEFGDLPIAMMGFNITQEKVPIYGFWNYTYSQVMRGVRIVEGQIVIAPKYPGYMRSVLAAAASARQENYGELEDDYPGSNVGLTEDDQNIEKYWSKHLDPAAIAQGMNEYSVHPPFNLVIVFGVQNTSVEVDGDKFIDYENDSALYKDHNQRLVEGFDPNRPTRYILEACELTGMETSYGAGGEVVYEKYSFFAKDIVLPRPDYRSPGTTTTPSPVNLPNGILASPNGPQAEDSPING